MDAIADTRGRSRWRRAAAAGAALRGLGARLISERSDEREARHQHFAELADRLGLRYTVNGSVPPFTPLLASGADRRFEHTLEGPLYPVGGPRTMIGWFSHRTGAADPQRFTVCVVELADRDPLEAVDAGWLPGYPLDVRYELAGGMLVVYVPGHELDADRMALLLRAARSFRPAAVVA